jgi:hypothetical protein
MLHFCVPAGLNTDFQKNLGSIDRPVSFLLALFGGRLDAGK